jgi:thiosulfate dehydrogenase (quinone) large subunit
MIETSATPASSRQTSNSSAVSALGSEYTTAFLLLRLFLGLRTLIAGIEKFEANKTFSFANYTENMSRMATGISNYSLIPLWAAKSFAMPLGFLLTLLGLAVLLGVKSRISLFLSGLVYVALGFGLMAVQEGEGVAWIGMQVLMFVAALVLVRHERFAVCPDKA